MKRDRNRPSVILWSIFNEAPLQGTEIGYEMARRMVAAIKALDTTRPITAAKSAVQALDVAGINYQAWEYDRFHIIGVGNGDPNSHEPDKAAARGLYNGLAQPVVRPAPRGVRSPCWWKHSRASRRA